MKSRILLILVALFATATQLAAQQMPSVPADPAVKVGHLSNGMTYYIRSNAKPAGQAEFYILHNVGAMQEDTTQIGLAHFLEHMAFNGTKNFPDKNLLNYLEKIGVKFGANLNAQTQREMTVYNMSSVPIPREGIIDSCLLILHDWSHYISLLPKEIDAERPVIIEELRTDNTGDFRVNEALYPVIFNHSKYAYRDVIGTEDRLKAFDYQTLIDFYHKWYRTDQQVIVVVGDFDAAAMEAKVKKVMSDIPAVENPAPKQVVTIPDNDKPLVGIATDPEATTTMISILNKRSAVPVQYNDKVPVVMAKLMLDMITTMETNRLTEIALKPGAAFVVAGAEHGPLTNTCDVFAQRAIAQSGPGACMAAFKALYTESQRIKLYGFTQGELDRVKSDMMRSARQAYDNRNDRRSGDMVETYLESYRYNTPMPDAETQWQMDSTFISHTSLDMINGLTKQAYTDQNMVITISAPQKEGVETPSQQDVYAAIDAIAASTIAPYADSGVSGPLVSDKLKGSPVKKTETDRFGATVWTLGNGARIVFKRTDFKADELIMSAQAKGGLSMLPDSKCPSAELLSTLVGMSGVGNFSATDLAKQLAGKAAGVNISVDEYESGMSGTCSPKDIETMMQLVYLYFTAPRLDKGDFDALAEKYGSVLANINKNPDYLMEKRSTEVLYGNNPRQQIISSERLAQARFEDMAPIYKQLFPSANGFTFTFVGNVDPQTLRSMVEKYIGSIPASKTVPAWKDDKVAPVKGEVNDRFTVPMQAPKSTVEINFTGQMPYSLDNMLVGSVLKQILDIRYTESIREEKGGAYGVRMSFDLTDLPEGRYDMKAHFDTNPDMVNDIVPIITSELVQIAKEGPKAEDMSKIREFMLKQRVDNLKRNGAWMFWISNYYADGIDMTTDYDKTLDSINAGKIKAMAAKIIADGNKVQVIMDPAK